MAAMFLDCDQDRLARRVAAVTKGDLNSEQIKCLVDGDATVLKDVKPDVKPKLVALMDLDTAKRGELEKIVGSTVDFVAVSFLERAWVSAKAVARVVDGRRRPLGTGVMVSPRLFMTNNHVIADEQGAATASVQFDYQLGLDDIANQVTEFRLDPTSFFWTSAETELDCSLIAIGQRITGERPLSHFGWTALSSAGDKHAEGDHVTVIEHPDGDYKQIALRENRVRGRGKHEITLYYSADTLGGSSGSPVFNDDFVMVALHHAGGPRNDDLLENDQPVPEDCNEGIRVSAIVKELRKVLDRSTEAPRDLLAEALNPPKSATPLERAATIGAPAPFALSPAIGTASNDLVPTLVTADLHLPRVRITGGSESAALGVLGRQPADAPVALLVGSSATTVAGGPVMVRNDAPDENYADRGGYDPQFLTQPVPVPTLTKDLLGECAVPKGSRRSKASVLVAYSHFSLVVHAARRMPLFTIVNIDGDRLREINRKTGAVETAETWYVDPRLRAEDQLEQPFFDHQRPRLFDRGHMVRRLDPAWGSPTTAKLAADDTFHFTNCCPQIAAFNQHLWQRIENYARDNAGTEKRRITVITGPVFSDEDRLYRDAMRVPRAFWKIVARVSDADGALRATGFLADQNAALDKAYGDGLLEEFADLGKVALFQKSIAEIEKLTGLSFGALSEHDTMSVSLEAISPELDALEDADW
ncbi:endonuclease G [Mycolicibacterium sp. BK634]|uniref:DNA/RNA non-specific endonuclease n=1 Tax=Mycolicibacterium sp. BK634 TaxID=2587099 RepID=UPI0016107E83|nr:DNA/RNA non-specific endonuclease [Mycolicibacterium sp. BK634]MBB3753779.1 endonuclease G [Mycolicibacterium sp. BK634]